jgi:uncharacterized protein YbaR (Trm112 family)
MDILACPICKHHPLKLYKFQVSQEELVEGLIICPECDRWYPIIEAIPHMLPDDLREEKEEVSFLKKWREKIPENILVKGKPFNLPDDKPD